MRRLIVPVVTGLIGVLVGGATMAFAVGTTGVINGCYNRTNGNLRVVEAGEACRTGESAISWSVSGGAGPAGATGATGGAGPAGANGATGATGANGTNGTNGTNGINGIDGAIGPQGPRGDTGVTGATGPQGPAGTGGGSALTFYNRFGNTSVPNTDTHLGTARAYCDPGDKALGGGYSAGNMTVEYSTLDSSTPGTEGWFVTARNNTALPQLLFMVVTCANTTP